jgi:hypothetical protein
MLPYKIHPTIPPDIENIIITFCYPVKTADELTRLAFFAWENSKQLPVPVAWKKLLYGPQIFCWRFFLNSSLDPFGMSTLVNLGAVRKTVQYLNWNYIKHQPNVATVWARATSKKRLLQELSFWTPQAVEHIFFLQRLLCSIDIPKAIIKHRCCRVCNFVVPKPNPLCFFVNPPRLCVSRTVSF